MAQNIVLVLLCTTCCWNGTPEIASVGWGAGLGLVAWGSCLGFIKTPCNPQAHSKILTMISWSWKYEWNNLYLMFLFLWVPEGVECWPEKFCTVFTRWSNWAAASSWWRSRKSRVTMTMPEFSTGCWLLTTKAFCTFWIGQLIWNGVVAQG